MHHLAIIGSGASAIFLLKHLMDEPSHLGVRRLTIFEKSTVIGVGMPYNPETTSVHNLSNISSKELCELPVSFVDWLRSQEPTVVRGLGIDPADISDGGIYSRLAIGRYLHVQYQTLIHQLAADGVEVCERPACQIADLRDDPRDGRVTLVTAGGEEFECDRVVIATGHRWPEEDDSENGWFASPWPIFKILPVTGDVLNFPVATLGASLSAFDVVCSMAHHQGTFERHDRKLTFHPHRGTDGFRFAMHSLHGLLPHLQYAQEEPLQAIYRHATREEMLALRNDRGFIRLDEYFDRVCRPALRAAFSKDGMPEIVAQLGNPAFRLTDFIETMAAAHEYSDPFEGMRRELVEARESVDNDRPIHWKETLDGLLYTLNYHAELLPAEDQLVLKGKFMPFVMNIIAALPLESAETLLALRDAGILELVSGEASIGEKSNGTTEVIIDGDGDEERIRYRMLVDCRGQKPLEVDEYPFPSLVAQRAVRPASVPFVDPAAVARVPEEKREHVIAAAAGPHYGTGGIEIDPAYRIVGEDGVPNPRIHDIAFPHTSGVRPYSYGLQACNDTASIVVRAWREELENRPSSVREPSHTSAEIMECGGKR